MISVISDASGAIFIFASNSDTQWIHAAYRILKIGVKHQTRKRRFWIRKRVNPWDLTRFSEMGLQTNIQTIFRTDMYRIVAEICTFKVLIDCKNIARLHLYGELLNAKYDGKQTSLNL